MKTSPSDRYGLFIKVIFIYIGVLLASHWLTVYLTNSGSVADASLFDLDREYNIPTYTNAFLLWSSAIVSFTLSIRSVINVQRFGWVLFGLFFTYLGFDEALIIHEQLGEPIRNILNITGSNPLYHAWVVPAIGIVTLIILTIFIIRRYYKQLRVFSRLLFLIALLATGVIACEILGTFIYDNTILYRTFMVPLEEIFELTMAAIILRSLLIQLKNQNGKKVSAK